MQVAILWELLSCNGFVVEGKFDLEKHLYLIERYLRNLIKLKNYLKLEIDLSKIDDSFYQDFEEPHNLKMLFLEKSPMDGHESVRSYFHYLKLNTKMVNYFCQNLEKEKTSKGFFEIFKKTSITN